MLHKLTRPELSLTVAGSIALCIALFIYPRFQPDYHVQLPLSEAEIKQRAADFLAAYSVSDYETEATIQLERNQPYLRRYVQSFGKAILTEQLQDSEKQRHLYSWKLHNQAHNVELSFSLNGYLRSLNADSLSIPGKEIPPFDSRNTADSEKVFHQSLGQPVLASSYWRTARKDSVQLRTADDGTEKVSLYYSMREAGVPVSIELQFTPSGKLISLDYSSDAELPSRSVAESAFTWIAVVLGVLIALLIGFIFFNRLFNRLIDVRMIKFDTAAVGLLVLLTVSADLYIDYSRGAFSETGFALLAGMLVVMSVLLVLSFVVIGTADSLTEEVWPAKKRGIALLRHGFIKNNVVGGALLRGTFAGFLMLGISAFLFISVDTSWYTLRDDTVYLSSASALDFFERVSKNILFTLAFIIVFVMIPASYLKKKRFKPWLIFLSVLGIGAMFSSNLPETGNEFIDLFISSLVFSVPVWIYLKYDTLSAVAAVFMYSTGTTGISALYTPELKDIYLLIFWFMMVSILLLIAYAGMQKEDELSDMPDLVPDYLKELAREQRIEQEFTLAREVQAQFLTSAQADIAGYDIASSCKTAYEVGGDYYDFISLDDSKTLVVIADVSGKGIKAAFYMTLLKGYLQSVSQRAVSVSDIMKTANQLFYENRTRGTFITVLAGILDAGAHTFEFVRAGHDPLFLLQSQKPVYQEFTPRGFPLGMTTPAVFDRHLETMRISMQKDTILILSTDGYPESRNIAGKQLGAEKLKQITIKHYEPEVSARSALSAIQADVLDFVGQASQYDDMTMIVIRQQTSKS